MVLRNVHFILFFNLHVNKRLRLKKLKENEYCSAKSSVIYTSNSVLSTKGKDLTSVKNISCVISTIKCCL